MEMWPSEGEEVGTDNKLLSSRRKDVYCYFNNLPYWRFYAIDSLPHYWSQSDHRGLLTCKYKSVLTWPWLPMPSLHLFSESKHPDSTVFAESRWLNIHVELHNSRISQLHSRAIYLAEAETRAGMTSSPDWDPHRVWWAGGLVCSVVASLSKSQYEGSITILWKSGKTLESFAS